MDSLLKINDKVQRYGKEDSCDTFSIMIHFRMSEALMRVVFIDDD